MSEEFWSDEDEALLSEFLNECEHGKHAGVKKKNEECQKNGYDCHSFPCNIENKVGEVLKAKESGDASFAREGTPANVCEGQCAESSAKFDGKGIDFNNDQVLLLVEVSVEAASKQKRFKRKHEISGTGDGVATAGHSKLGEESADSEIENEKHVKACQNEVPRTEDNKTRCSADDGKTFSSEQSHIRVKVLEFCDKQNEVVSPLQMFRPGYLWVSDLTRQNWCEQQLYYTFTVPGFVEEKPVMTEGSNLHLERELAVHDVVDVKVTSDEDIWGIKVLNLNNSVQVFLNNGTLAREVPIFGALFGEDVFLVGLIDELRFDSDLFQIELWELKTRKRKSLPSKSQKIQHRLQVMLYKKLFDDMVKGFLRKETVAKHLKLSLTQEFGSDIQKQIESSCLTSKNLDQLMDVLFARMQCVTCIQGLGIEYVHQDSKETIGLESKVYNEMELRSMYEHYLKFWKGERRTQGVDIEEAWKCQSCDFADICEWREQKALEYSQKNLMN